MKTINQLLKLVKNPYYKLSPAEQEVLDDFLLKSQGEPSQKSQKKSSTESSKKTRVTVRNIVRKVDTYPPEDPETGLDESETKK